MAHESFQMSVAVVAIVRPSGLAASRGSGSTVEVILVMVAARILTSAVAPWNMRVTDAR
jgi:hypothetical protein